MSLLYLPSTPWNLYLSVAHAVQSGESGHRLLLLDQCQPSPYLSALEATLGDVFEAVDQQVLSGKGLDKWRQRQQTFAQLDQWLKNMPDLAGIAVGSDRRVEFQYATAKASASCSVAGHYLDDGLYSYMGRPWRPVKDRLDGWLKKAVYGRWWQTPPMIGASDWITDVWAWMPDRLVPPLKSKHVHSISPTWFQQGPVQEWVAQLLETFGVTSEQLDVDLLLLLTHPNNARKMPGYEARVQALLARARKAGMRVAAKYHPRVGTADPFEVRKAGARLLPAGMVFEFVLPLLPARARLIGDVSTTVLSARWLRPDLPVFAVLDATQPFQQRVEPILKASGAQIIHPEQIDQCIS